MSPEKLTTGLENDSKDLEVLLLNKMLLNASKRNLNRLVYIKTIEVNIINYFFMFLPLDISTASGKLNNTMNQPYLFAKQLKKFSPLTTRVCGLAAV